MQGTEGLLGETEVNRRVPILRKLTVKSGG